MCLAIPGKVIEFDNDVATVSIDGVITRAGLAISEDVAVGDYVIVHAGYVLRKLSPVEATEEITAIRAATDLSLADGDAGVET